MAALNKTRSWEAFTAWCDDRGLCAAPANPWTLAAYIRFVEGSMRYDALKRHIDQVGQMHFEQRRTRPDRHATVKRVLDAARRREETKKQAKKRPPPAAPLFEAEDFLNDKKPNASRAPRTKAKSGTKKKSLRATPKLVRRKRV